MRWTIRNRIFVALTVACLVIVALNAIATRWSFQRGFADYLTSQETERLSVVVEKLAEMHVRDGSWVSLRKDPRLWSELFDGVVSHRRPPQHNGPKGRRPPNRDDMRPPDPPDLKKRVSLIDARGTVAFGPDIRADKVRRVDVVVDGEVVAQLLVRPQVQLTKVIDLRFAKEQTRSSLYIGGAMLLLAALLSAIIARQIASPIASLTGGTKALTAGSFDKRITVARDDEFGDLARDFNELAKSLETSQRVRRQWVSDISHELRTPLAILSGELQAIEDGVREFDGGTRKSLQAEVERLRTLVADLHELTMSDEGGLRYQHETINIIGILRETLEVNAARISDAGLQLDVKMPQEDLLISGDSSRLDQLFTNLVENSIRYTDSPGVLNVRVASTPQEIQIVFSDSAPGVALADYERLFDRLYRADASRNRSTGGSGLGLSICESIVNAHSGQVVAEPSGLGGVAVRISFPNIQSNAVNT